MSTKPRVKKIPGMRIAIVERKRGAAKDLSEKMTGLGYAVVARVPAKIGAIRKAVQKQPDLAIVDAGATGALDPVKIARRIQHQANIPVIFTTSFPPDDATLGRLFRAGASGYIDDHMAGADLRREIENARSKFGGETAPAGDALRLGLLGDAAFEGLIVASGEAIVDVNNEMPKMLGVSRAELIGQDLGFPIALESKEFMRVNLRTLQGGMFECDGIRKDGSRFPVEIRVRSIAGTDPLIRTIAVRDITGRKKIENALLRRAGIEEIISGVSSRLISIPPGHLQTEVVHAMKDLGQLIGVDRCSLQLYSEDTSVIEQTFEWHNEHLPLHTPLLTGRSLAELGWSLDKFQRFETVCVLRVTDLPAAAMAERALWESMGIVSILTVPLTAGGKLLGQLSFDTEEKEKTWMGEDIRLIQLMGNTFAGVIARERALGRLRRSEERYRRMSAALTNYVFSVRIENGVAVETVHGPGSVAVTGYAPDELARDPGLWLRSIHSQDRPAALEHFRRILSGHKREPLECRIIRKDGREIWVRSTPVLHFDDAGSLIAYDALIQDITEATLAREALRESEEKYRVLVENLHEVIFSVDANGFISYVSPIVEDLTGFGPEEITGEHFARFVHPHDRPLVEQQWQRTMQGQVGEYEFRVLTKWGDTRTVRMSSRQRMEAGEPSGLVGILSDRTERKKAEGELRHTEKCLRDILQKLHIPAVRIDGIGAIEYCNDAFLRLTARGRSTVIGKNWFDEFVSPHRRDSARAEYQGSLTAEPFPAEYTLELCGESAMGREARMRTTVTRDHDGNPTGVIGLGEGEV